MAEITPLSWLDLSRVTTGTPVVFARDYGDTSTGRVIEAGTRVTLMENGLNEIWGGLILATDHPAAAHDGTLWLGATPGHSHKIEPEDDPAWLAPSPLALAEAA